MKMYSIEELRSKMKELQETLERDGGVRPITGRLVGRGLV